MAASGVKKVSFSDRQLSAVCNFIKEKESEHNLITQAKRESDSILYGTNEVKVVGQTMLKYCFTQMYIHKKGLEKFKSEGVQAAKSELKQMHDRTCFCALAVAKLTRHEQKRAMEALMFLTEKKTKEIKGRLAYNVKPTCNWILREDKSSSTAHTESILLTAGIDAMVGWDVMSLDIPNAFIQTSSRIRWSLFGQLSST